ncbi:MAG: hypothetical protein ACW98D_20770, partial [Promethearchaeota archaeon]
MRYKVITMLLAALVITVPLQSKPTAKLQKSSSGYTLGFELLDLKVKDVDTLGQPIRQGYGSEVFSRLNIADYSRTEDVGKPELPFKFFYMAVSDPGQVPTFEVL